MQRIIYCPECERKGKEGFARRIRTDSDMYCCDDCNFVFKMVRPTLPPAGDNNRQLTNKDGDKV